MRPHVAPVQFVDTARALSALQILDPGTHRGEWIRVTAAAQDAGVPFEDWHAWCSQGSNYAGERDCTSVWRSIHPGGGITAATLFALAKAAGWNDDGVRVLEAQAVSPKPEVRPRRPMLDPAGCLQWQAPPSDHDYLRRKMVAAVGLKVAPSGLPSIAGYDVTGWLVVPAWSLETGEVQSLQFIAGEFPGTKLNLPGASLGGCAFTVHADAQDGKLTEAVFAAGTAHIAEGLATAHTINRASGECAVVTFGKGNARRIARLLRDQYPNLRIVLCLDRGSELAARTIADDVSGCVVDMPEHWPPNSDLNDIDLAGEDGLDRVRELLRSAIKSSAVPQEDHRIVMFAQPALDVADVRDGTSTTRALTEVGNAMRLLDQHGARLRFIPETGRWLVWRNGAWVWDGDGATVRAAAAALPDAIYEEGQPFKADERMHFARWGRSSQNARVIRAAASILSDQHALRLPQSAVDADPMLVGLACARQILDLRTGDARPAKPTD